MPFVAFFFAKVRKTNYLCNNFLKEKEKNIINYDDDSK